MIINGKDLKYVVPTVDPVGERLRFVPQGESDVDDSRVSDDGFMHAFAEYAEREVRRDC